MHNCLDQWCTRPVVHLRNSEPVLGRTIPPELDHNLGHEHHKCGAGAVCTQRGTYHDTHGPRSAHRRCNRAHLSRPVVHLRNSEPVLGRTISPELDHNLGHEHHKCSAGAVCTQRGTYHDAYGPLSAHRRCNCAHLSRPVVHLRNSEPVLGLTIPPELDHNLGHEHHKCSAGTLCTQRGTYHDAYGPLSAHRRCIRAHLSRPVVHLRNSELRTGARADDFT